MLLPFDVVRGRFGRRRKARPFDGFTEHQSERYLKNGPFLASFSFIFGLFQANNTILQLYNVKNVHTVSGIWIRTHNK